MKAVVLTKGKIAIVDDDDFDEIAKHKWYYNCGYAKRHTRLGKGGKREVFLMHRVIAKTPAGMDTDHKNHDKLDNRKENLRCCLHSQNMANTRKYSVNKSGYKGVYWAKHTKKWRAQIRLKSVKIHVGYFHTKEASAAAYDRKAKEIWGEFAKTNY